MVKKKLFLNKGFTLIELLTVIGIIMILVMLAGTAARKAVRHSQKMKCMANLKNLYTMSLLYFQENKALPDTETNQPVESVQLIAKDQAKNMVCPAIRGENSSLVSIPETVLYINGHHVFMDFSDPLYEYSNYPLFSDTDIVEVFNGNIIPPHNGTGYAVLTNGRIIEFSMQDIQTNLTKFLATASNITKTWIPPTELPPADQTT
ncbi:MAG: type II secretion system protein [Candidatus Aureabacteria bacterium]|nr:type II secretion system protein [Candidatus Auribacterota bacterium]